MLQAWRENLLCKLRRLVELHDHLHASQRLSPTNPSLYQARRALILVQAYQALSRFVIVTLEYFAMFWLHDFFLLIPLCGLYFDLVLLS